MNKKKTKRRKEPKKGFKTTTKNGETEVFVLPPDLLQKLGINLGSIKTTQECPTDTTSEMDKEVSDAPVTSHINKESDIVPETTMEKEKHRDTSILETADLMKKSVFLSPTFSTAGNNMESGELEISNVVAPNMAENATQSSHVVTAAFNNVSEQVGVAAKPLSQINILADKHNLESNAEIVGNNESNLNREYEIVISDSLDNNYNSLSTQDNNQITVNNNAITDISEKRGDIPDDHPDEAYLSDCSNCTSGPSDSAGPTLKSISEIPSFDFEIPKVCQNKIKIISEEILSPSKFRDLQIMLSPTKSNYIPVSMNCVLTSNNFCENFQYGMESAENLKNEYELPSDYETVVSNGDIYKKMDVVVLYDEKGNVISTVNNNISANDVDSPMELKKSSNFDTITDGKIDDLSQTSNEASIAKGINSVMHASETNFGDIDLVVIDMEIEENEDSLVNFVKEITSNDDDNILKKIEQSEKYCSPIKSNYESPKTDLECIQLKSILDICGEKKKEDKFVTNTSHSPNSTLIGLNKTDNLSKSEQKNTDAVLQVFEMATNCNGIQSDIETKDYQQDDNVNNKQHNFETDMISIKCNATESLPKIATQTECKVRTSEVFAASLNSNLLKDTYLQYVQKCTASIIANSNKPKNDNTKSDKTECPDNDLNNLVNKISENLPIDRNNSSMSQFLDDDVKKTGKNDEDFQLTQLKDSKTNEKGIGIKDLNEHVVCVESNRMTTIEVKSNEQDKNTPTELANDKSRKRNNKDKKLDNNASDEKIKEIAMYLSQFAKAHNNSVKQRRNSDKKTEIPTKRSKQNPLTSKMYIQGVEKPGGAEKPDENYKIKQVVKTYTRPNNSKRKSIPIPLAITSTTSIQDICIADYEKEINSKIVEKCSKTPKFCICGDFGRLGYYDSDCPYEHIHFWDHKFVHCDRECVFSIYNDNCDINIIKITEISDAPVVEAQSGDEFVHSICWHSCKREPDLKQSDTTVVTGKYKVSEKNEDQIVSKRSKFNECNHTVEQIQTNSLIDECLDSTSAAENQQSELNKLDFNATEASTSLIEQNVGAAIPIPNVKSCIDTASHKKVQKKISLKNNNKDKPTDLPERNLKMEDSNTYGNTANEDTTSSKSKKNLEMDVKDKKDKSVDSKNIDVVDVHKHIALSGNQNTTKNYATGKFSRIGANVSKHFDNVDVSVDNQNVVIESNRRTSDQFEPEKCTDTTESRISEKKRQLEKMEKDLEEEPVHKKSVKCEICKKIISKTQWKSHVETEHCFIAWKSGCSFDFENPRLLKKLQERVKNNSSLKCTFCSAELKHPKKFITHVQKCFSEVEDSNSLSESSADEPLAMMKSAADPTFNEKLPSDGYTVNQIADNLFRENHSISSEEVAKCDVCKEVMPATAWIEHIKVKHQYLAWKDSDSPLDLACEESVRSHLHNILRETGELKCANCGLARKYAKSYLQHVRQCSNEFQITQDDIQIPSLAEAIADPSTQPNFIKCGVCNLIMLEPEWMQHIMSAHDYLAWKVGEEPLNTDDQDSVWHHLDNISKQIDGLVCYKCGVIRKYPKSYMQHVYQCTSKTTEVHIPNVSPIEEPRNLTDAVKCAVCSQSMMESEWLQHIVEKHEYLAWKEGDQPLDLNSPDSVRMHLVNICRRTVGLVCNRCGCIRKYVKSYMHHVASCKGPTEKAASDFDNPLIKFKVEVDSSARDEADGPSNSMVTCGVCGKEVWSEKWFQHIGRFHNYMAWKAGSSLNVYNKEEVYNHLYEVIRKTGYLVCSKCGCIRKYVNTFLQHMKNCNSDAPAADYDDCKSESDGKLICAVCSEEVSFETWKNHKMENHYNIAWTLGSIPVDIKNPNVIDTLMKEYLQKYKKLVCKVCNASRVSRVGFYAHIIQCGKSEEEVDKHRNTCSICNKKYLIIYHSQHMTWHNQQEYSKAKKLREAEEQEQDLVKEMTKPELVVEGTPGRRKAAQKARNIIEKFKNDEFLYKCPNCKFGCDSKEELANHICKKTDDGSFSDSGESAKIEDEGDESDDSIEVDSNISDEEQEETKSPKKKKKKKYYTQHVRFPHVPKNLLMFLAKIGAEFHQQHFTYDTLFPELRIFDCEPVPTDQLTEYLPPLEESCKVQFCDDNWKTYTRFEAEQRHCANAKTLFAVPCQSIFTGGCIQCVSWSPPGPDAGNYGGNFLAVACHRGPDIVRMQVDEIAEHPALIQLWGFGDFSQVAELVFGLAHNYGTVWAMDWCPSGARDVCPEEPVVGNVLRLGLLAVAFSNGRVMIFSIPYPSTLLKRNKVIQRLKPVAELRLTMNPDRRTYQATSVNWSMQKPNESIVVGYADGTTAYFDLNTESPFLKTVENDVLILYPYHDERVHNNCITGVSLYPSVDGIGPAGAACCSSSTGVALLARPAVRTARQHVSSAIAGVQFEPLWPSAALLGDDANVTSAVNELEWYGGGRRMGGGSAGAGCRRCGRFVFAALPLLRVRYPHPADNLAKRQVVGLLQMTPLAKKRKKLVNDELQTKVEPTTYEDAIRTYGIELRMDKESIDKAANKPRELYPERFPERFPLGDVTSMAFCPEGAHHKQLAVATHSGILFVLKV